LPELYPNSGTLSPSSYAYQAVQALKPPIWNGTELQLVPSFSWGGRVADAPPNFPFPSYLNTNQTHDLNGNITKIKGNHTLKAGVYWNHSYKAQQAGQNGNNWQGAISFANDTNNPLDSGFGFANAALGIFDTYTQQSKYVEGDFVYNNIEAFVQDTWKIRPRLTLDYGIRFVHMSPQYDEGGNDVNFVPSSWNLSNAPVFYTAVCAPGVAAPCSGTNRDAFNPVTGQSLGIGSGSAIGTLVQGSGSLTDGLFQAGQGGVPKEDYFWPTLEPAPRLGIAYEPSASHRIVLRGGVGMFYDRPAGNTVFTDIVNPPVAYTPTLYYGTLQTLNTPGLSTLGASGLNLYQLNSDYSTVVSWSGGAEVTLPQSVLLNVSYNGTHAYNIPESVNINAVDFGSAFLPQNQDPTTTSTLAGGAAVSANQMRAYRGFGSMTDMLPRGYSNTDFLIMALQRRFTHGLSFGINDSWLLHQAQPAGARLQHASDGTWSYRSDQAAANQLYGDYVPTAHTFKGYFVYAIPGLTNGGSGFAGQAARLTTNGWQLSGIWSANTGTAYAIGTSFANGASTSTNITGSGDYGGNVSVAGNPGSGCSGNLYQQFNTGAFAPPAVGSVGLSSPQYPYIRGCFFQDLDLSLQRQIRIKEHAFGPARRFQRDEPGPRHWPKHDHAGDKPDQCHHRQFAVHRPWRFPGLQPRPAEGRWFRHGQRVPVATKPPDLGAARLLKYGVPAPPGFVQLSTGGFTRGSIAGLLEIRQSGRCAEGARSVAPRPARATADLSLCGHKRRHSLCCIRLLQSHQGQKGPLIIALHGPGGNPNTLMHGNTLDLAEEGGFIVRGDGL
jgi:hypothetical protein